MALIICPECNNQTSSKAALCPKCGFPIADKIDSLAKSTNSSVALIEAKLTLCKKRMVYSLISVVFATLWVAMELSVGNPFPEFSFYVFGCGGLLSFVYWLKRRDEYNEEINS
jgi:uncharacterized membrane protein YvbJ